MHRSAHRLQSTRKRMESLPWIITLGLWIAIRAQGKVDACANDGMNQLLLGRPHLHFGPGKTFKIALMADLHYGEAAWTDWGPEQDVKSTHVQDTILDTEKPEFVIYLGDQVTANNVIAANSSKYWAQSMGPAFRRSIPHASVFGNHDDAFMVYDYNWFGSSGIPGLPAENVGYYHSTTREELTKAEIEMETSLTRPGPNDLWPSMSNYVLTVSSAKVPGNVAVLLYFLDSGGGSYPEIVSAFQAAWFKARANRINPHGSIPELVFFHIPTRTHEKICPTPKTRIQFPCVGSINLEMVAPQEQERGLMDVLINRKSVKVRCYHLLDNARLSTYCRDYNCHSWRPSQTSWAVFTGHNHGLDWCCPHHDLWVCFARHTGYRGYGTWERGSRILELTEEPDFALKSWIRLEKGDVVAEINLT